MNPSIKKWSRNAALAITDTMRSTTREKLYQELGLESLRKRRSYRKISESHYSEYFCKILPSVNKAYNTRTNSNISLLHYYT